MTQHNQSGPQTQPTTDRDLSASLANVRVEDFALPSLLICEGSSQLQCERLPRDNPRMAGKPRRHTLTREGQRFSWLVVQLEREGLSQAEICRRTGISTTHLNQLRNIERGSRSGIGAEIVRKVKDGLQIDPAYFFDDYEGEKPFQLFLLSAKRDEKRVSALEDGLAAAQRTAASQAVELARLNELLLRQTQGYERPRSQTPPPGAGSPRTRR